MSSLPSVVLVKVPKDNDCLYHCIQRTCFENTGEKENVDSIRTLCAYLMDTSPEFKEFAETVKRDTMETLATVLKPGTWGGPDELAMFSKLKEVEFVLISEETKDIITRICFPEGANYSNRVYLYWCGVAQPGEKILQKRMVHYNYFANALDGKGLFTESSFPDKDVLQQIAKCIGSETLSLTAALDKTSISRKPPEEKEKSRRLEAVRETEQEEQEKEQGKEESRILIRCPGCGTCTLFQLPIRPH